MSEKRLVISRRSDNIGPMARPARPIKNYQSRRFVKVYIVSDVRPKEDRAEPIRDWLLIFVEPAPPRAQPQRYRDERGCFPLNSRATCLSCLAPISSGS